MGTVDIFYQGEGLREIEHTVIDESQTFGRLRTLLIEKHGLDHGVRIFVEDADEPIGDEANLHEYAERAGVKVHVHRCHKIEVTVTFNGKRVERKFGPGTTVARVKYWAAEEKFGMTRDEASEHVLQVSGSQVRPAPGTHLGSLTRSPNCCLAFDLVPDHRVNGAPGDKR